TLRSVTRLSLITALGSRATSGCQSRVLRGAMESHHARAITNATTAPIHPHHHGRTTSIRTSEPAAISVHSAAASTRFFGPSIQIAATLHATTATMTTDSTTPSERVARHLNWI